VSIESLSSELSAYWIAIFRRCVSTCWVISAPKQLIYLNRFKLIFTSPTLTQDVPQFLKAQIARNAQMTSLELCCLSFNVLLIMHPSIIVFFTNLMQKLFILYFNTSIICLYMFRACLRSSSGGQNCTRIASGVNNLIRWPFSTVVSLPVYWTVI
jgi:hypothetical protein